MSGKKSSERRIRPGLEGVPETMLWALWHRAAFSAGPMAILTDPMAVDLVRRIDYPFRQNFGRPLPWHALRARAGDRLIGEHLRRRPAGTVVSLGAGLETQFWRVNPDRKVRWIGVELPEAIAIRQRLLPKTPQCEEIACSATDPAWMESAPAGDPVFVQAAGLLMYLQPYEVEALISRLFQRFPGATLHFDTLPPLASQRTLEGMWVTKHYKAPPMPWGISYDDIEPFVTGLVPGASVRVATYADAAPWMAPWGWWASLLPALRNGIAPCLVTVKGPEAGSELDPCAQA